MQKNDPALVRCLEIKQMNRKLCDVKGFHRNCTGRAAMLGTPEGQCEHDGTLLAGVHPQQAIDLHIYI